MEELHRRRVGTLLAALVLVGVVAAGVRALCWHDVICARVPSGLSQQEGRTWLLLWAAREGRAEIARCSHPEDYRLPLDRWWDVPALVKSRRMQGRVIRDRLDNLREMLPAYRMDELSFRTIRTGPDRHTAIVVSRDEAPLVTYHVTPASDFAGFFEASPASLEQVVSDHRRRIGTPERVTLRYSADPPFGDARWTEAVIESPTCIAYLLDALVLTPLEQPDFPARPMFRCGTGMFVPTVMVTCTLPGGYGMTVRENWYTLRHEETSLFSSTTPPELWDTLLAHAPPDTVDPSRMLMGMFGEEEMPGLEEVIFEVGEAALDGTP